MHATVVIADDHPIVLAGIRHAIERDPRLEVVGQAQDPSSLVALMHAHTPDIVITDYNMPGNDALGDGIKLVSYLLRHFPHSRLLVLTMVSNPSIIAAMYRAGAGGVVRKSGDSAELGLALSALLARRIYRPMEQTWADRAAASTTPTARLSPREFEVLRLFANGRSVGDIARLLSRSIKTVSTQKVSAMRKLGTRTDQELISFCLASDLFR